MKRQSPNTDIPPWGKFSRQWGVTISYFVVLALLLWIWKGGMSQFDVRTIPYSQPAAMQELMGQKHPITTRWKAGCIRPGGIGESCRHDSEQVEKTLQRLLWQRQFIEKHQRINQNQRACNHGH